MRFTDNIYKYIHVYAKLKNQLDTIAVMFQYETYIPIRICVIHIQFVTRHVPFTYHIRRTCTGMLIKCEVWSYIVSYLTTNFTRRVKQKKIKLSKPMIGYILVYESKLQLISTTWQIFALWSVPRLPKSWLNPIFRFCTHTLRSLLV